MKISDWIYSLSSTDHLILITLYCICIYLSKITLETLIELYDEKKGHRKYRIQFRITPAILLSLAFIYSLFFYKILKEVFNFIP